MILRNSALIILATAALFTQTARADCVNPPGVAGEQFYNGTHKIMQFCDGTTWWAMRNGGGLPDCAVGQTIVKTSTGWGCNPDGDTTPAAFTFTGQTDVALSTLIQSNILQITGIDVPSRVSITGNGSPAYRVCSDSACSTVVADWSSGHGLILNNLYLQLRLTSNAANSTMNSATVTVGTVNDQWDVTTVGADSCAGSPSPGDVCADGSVYAGLSPDGNVKMYTTPADAGQFTWNNGTTNSIDTAMSNTSYATGEANTSLLVGLANADSPYDAAVYCDGLSAHGHSDWYLPARDELNVLYTNRAAIGGFNTSGSFPAGYYWSSSENDADDAWYQWFSIGSQLPDVKDNGFSVRCVRR